MDLLTALYNEKVKTEKETKGGTKKAPTKAMIKGGGKSDATVKKQLVNQVMGGDDDDYGEEYGYEEDEYYEKEEETKAKPVQFSMGTAPALGEEPVIKGGRVQGEKVIDFM